MDPPPATPRVLSLASAGQNYPGGLRHDRRRPVVLLNYGRQVQLDGDAVCRGPGVWECGAGESAWRDWPAALPARGR